MEGSWKDRWLVIVNPNAGGGKYIQDWPRIEGLLKKYRFTFHSEFTRRKLHGMVMTRQFIREGCRKIIVVGGDGTLNEVINGIFSQKACATSDIVIGMIPFGTGNDWGRMFGISTDYETAIRTIMDSRIFTQDTGKVIFQKNSRTHKRYFINIAGLGFDALVVKKSNILKNKGKSHPLIYKYNIFTSLFGYRAPSATIEVDGKSVTNRIFNISVGICKYNGGGMMPLPNASADDGLFDLTVIKKIARWDVIRSMKRLYDGTIVNHKKVETYLGERVNISSNTDIYLETDGESLGHTPIVFEMYPKSITVISALDSA